MAWLLFHVALHKDVQKNLTVEVKNSISRGVCKYFSEYFFFCWSWVQPKRNTGKSEEFVYWQCLFVCLFVFPSIKPILYIWKTRRALRCIENRVPIPLITPSITINRGTSYQHLFTPKNHSNVKTEGVLKKCQIFRECLLIFWPAYNRWKSFLCDFIVSIFK